jgi:hypothetical protein
MRKLPAAAQAERRRQVISLRQSGMTWDCPGSVDTDDAFA